MRRLPQFSPSGKSFENNGREGAWVEVHARSAERMRRMDALPQGLREIVHDFNMQALSAAISHGLRSPEEIREVLEIMQRDGLDKAIEWADQILIDRQMRAKPVTDGQLVRPKR